MIDIHSHILHGLDDGARSFQEAVEMVGIAARTGTTDIVASPHANFEVRFDPDLVNGRVAELQKAAGDTIRIHHGCDFHLSNENIRSALADPTRYTINNKGYLLVEFPDVLIAPSTPQDFARLIDAGMTPIITHPERNYLLHRRIADLRAWVEAGALMQVTGQSLLGKFGNEARNFARQLMDASLVHFIASDAHDTKHRTPRLDQAYAHIAKRWGHDRAELLCVANPKAVLTGDPLPPQQSGSGKKWFQFWKS